MKHHVLVFMSALAAAAASTLAAPARATAQGVQVGEVRGVVSDETGAVTPGATITLRSPAVQGERSTEADGQGNYIVRGLPPGTYTATFALAGFATLERTIELPLGGIVEVNVALSPEPISTTVTIVGQAQSAVKDPQVTAGLRKDEVDVLPVGRSPFGIASIMPGLTTNTPNGGQLAIAGAFGYDNVFLVDGTDVNDNLFGSADTLYVEDAIDATQVLTGGISAEYGRFSGGVVNVVSRRGGDTFTGSFRETLTNPTWTGLTPFEKDNGITRTSTLNKVHEGTFGGPIVRGRVWFFGAGRLQKTSDEETFSQTGTPYVIHDENKRGQINVTMTLAPNQTLSAQFLTNASSSDAPPLGIAIDPATLTLSHYPNTQFVTSYRATMRSRAFVEAQYSQKRAGFRDAGGTSTALVDSPIISSNPVGLYNAPYFDAADPEDRDNHQASASLSYLLSRVGRHDLKVGGEVFRSTNRGGNSQSATNYVFDTEYLKSGGKPVLDGLGHIIPLFVPGFTNIEHWLPAKGAEINITTTSFYARDRWILNKHVSADVGTRFEMVRSKATGGIVGVDTQAIVPRLGVSFDPKGDGRFGIESTYSHYAGKYSEAQFSRNTNVGNPDALFGIYTGPAGQGRSFAPGFDPNNYVIVDGAFPTANVFFDKGLSSPITKEFTLQAGALAGEHGYVKTVYTRRHVTRLVEDFITLSTGTTLVSKGGVQDVFSNIVYRNSDVPQRQYQAVQFVGHYTPTSRFAVDLAWTVQLKNDGNFVGEGASQPGVSSPIGDYPEAFNEARTYPMGRLPSYQRNVMRVWSMYRLDLGRTGDITLGGLLSANSALTYSLVAGAEPLSQVQQLKLAGYTSQPASQNIYFGSRGSGSYNSYNGLDLSILYTLRMFTQARPWIKFEIFNALGNDKLVFFDTTISPDPNSPLDSLGLRTGYVKETTFGQATGSSDYLTPRTFRLAIGVRF